VEGVHVLDVGICGVLWAHASLAVAAGIGFVEREEVVGTAAKSVPDIIPPLCSPYKSEVCVEYVMDSYPKFLCGSCWGVVDFRSGVKSLTGSVLAGL